MLYSILKDEIPANTVKKIKKILSGLNIELEEFFIEEKNEDAPVSLRLYLKNNPKIGVNGKGTCRENALASAYAEFMERLQNLLLVDYSISSQIIPDKVYVGKKYDFNNIDLNNYFKKKISVFFKMKQKNQNDEELFLLPFYSVKTNSISYLPANIVSKIKGSNGMSAGNTLEEAIVQGLSEICERYVLKRVFSEKLIMPDIPKENYLKYEKIEKIVSYFEINGFRIYVKDASLGGQVPVVCTIIEDVKNGVFCPSFGAQPSMPIAIERSLTEFAQGMMLSSLKESKHIGYQYYSKAKLKDMSSKNIFQSLFLHKVAFDKTSKIGQMFFSRLYSNEFNSQIWEKSFKQTNNKEILSYLIEKILNFSNDIYVRDVSFLGFPTVDIFVPNVSDIYDYDEKSIAKRDIDKYWSLYYSNDFRNSYTIENLLKLAEIYSYTDSSYTASIVQVPYEYIAFLCSVVLKDKKRILKYIKLMLEQHKLQNCYDENQILLMKIIRDYYLLLEKTDEVDIIVSKLSKKYDKDDVEYALDIINELTYEMVIDISFRKNKSTNFKNKLLIKKLNTKYNKNVPNQLDLYSIIKD